MIRTECLVGEPTSKMRIIAATMAALLLPAAMSNLMAQAANDEAKSGESAQTPKADYPQIIKAVPDFGETGIDPELAEITVIFDRDMGQGMSWTGGAPLFPPVDESRKPRWTDACTCVLPVKLAAGGYYRLGVNSTGAKNFRSETGQAAPPAVLYFATKGADAETEARVKAPRIASISPENGAADVDPNTDSLRVKFDIPMDEGMSWTGGGPQFPKLAEGKKPSWSADGLTCTLPVSLEPNHEYQLGLNSLEHINFQSRWGVPLKPAVYKFRTRAKAAK